MNFDMFSGRQDENLDPNYIYPMPYIDPMMYANTAPMNNNSYANYQMDPNMNMGGYATYMNPYILNPVMPQQEQSNEDNEDAKDTMNMNMQMQMQHGQMQNMYGNMQPNMQCIPPHMMQGMMPMMPPQMMQGMQGMMPGMMPMMQGMYPHMMSGMMPGMMFPYMMPGMPQIHMDEFDEEEM